MAHNLRPISFKLVKLTGTVAVFENLEHDFPQRIEYSLEGDQLTGRIEGDKKRQDTRRGLSVYPRIKPLVRPTSGGCLLWAVTLRTL
jgi:hypothetical protein